MVITIDGPAGTGKSTVARQVAERLSYAFLDTGAMYRAIGLEAIRRNADLANERELEFVARHCRIEFDWSTTPPAVVLNGERVSHQLRSGDATRAASFVAVVPAIRAMMVDQQRAIGRLRREMVTEGRDQGSVVFPDAELKVYLSATPEERARRRANELRARGEVVDVTEIRAQIDDRDHRDSTRATGPLRQPPGSVLLDTTEKTIPQVVDEIVSLARSRQPHAADARAAEVRAAAPDLRPPEPRPSLPLPEPVTAR
jgi:cytidylate kinase